MKTLAFVIGNNNYYEGAQLRNAINDAESIAQVFERLTYDVHKHLDCKSNDYSQIIDRFKDLLKDYEASIFYYAGHGFEVGGENYLASIDCQVLNSSKGDCNRTCIRLSELLDIYRDYPDKLNIVIIDACRQTIRRGGGNQFTPMQAPQGTLIAFSTSPNECAQDGGGNGHSVYTNALLQYIGREYLSVEDLFKKVRKTVYNLTEGAQVPWEHTSLIGDFVFNTGQLVYSPEIPYDECAVRDKLFNEGGVFGSLIQDLRSCNWYRQNSAIHKLNTITPSTLNKNQQFVLGRNLYQASSAYDVEALFEELGEKLRQYDDGGENHVLNGILFEIYFNKNGEFRTIPKNETHIIEKVFALRNDSRYTNSFDFIGRVLQPYREQLFYIPSATDTPIDVDIIASSQKSDYSFLPDYTDYTTIDQIKVGAIDITDRVSTLDLTPVTKSALTQRLSQVFTAPISLIHIHCNITLQDG